MASRTENDPPAAKEYAPPLKLLEPFRRARFGQVFELTLCGKIEQAAVFGNHQIEEPDLRARGEQGLDLAPGGKHQLMPACLAARNARSVGSAITPLLASVPS